MELRDTTMAETTTATANNVTLPTNTSVNVMTTSDCDTLQIISNFLHSYYIWIIFALGFPGNLVSLFVIVRMSHGRVTSSLFFVAILAVVDNIVIILKIIGKRVVSETLHVNETRCQFLYFFGLTLAAFANWILVVISAERYTAVKNPFKVKLVWSLRKSIAAIISCFICLCLIHVHIFFTTTGKDYTCTVIPRYGAFYYPYWFAISSTIYSFLPAVSLTVFNILIIHMLRRLKAERCNFMMNSTVDFEKRARQDRQMTVMLVALALVFICLTVPRCVFILFSQYLGGSTRHFLDTLTSSIADTNHAVNFYLYILMGRKFRKYLQSLLPCADNAIVTTYTDDKNKTKITTK